jgi:hypothetical protein
LAGVGCGLVGMLMMFDSSSASQSVNQSVSVSSTLFQEAGRGRNTVLVEELALRVSVDANFWVEAHHFATPILIQVSV